MLNNEIEKLSNNLINKYIKSLLTDNDLKLLGLIFKQNPTQEELDDFLKFYDIEVAGGYKALMLSYFMRMHPDLNFTQYENQRLKGLFNYYRFQNVKLLSYFIKIGKKLNKNNIPMLILKGFAMKYLRPELSRAMGDVDILVPENKFVKTIKLIKSMGYRLDVYVHSIDIHEPDSDAGILDVHRYIDMKNRKERPLNKYLFKRAKEDTYNGIKILVPCEEDLLFLSLINLALNLQEKTSKPSTLYVLFDCQYLLSKPNFNFNIVIENIKLTQSQNQIAYAIRFINTIIPNLIPKELSDNKILRNRVNNNCINVLFKTKYFPALQKLSRKIKLKKVLLNEISFLNYLKLKLLYKLCKFISNKQIFLIKAFILQTRKRGK